MSEAGVGRVLVASLHQAIGEILPMRLTFYENWLNTSGLRDGTIGLAPMYAVLSFLRLEGGSYEDITSRAGEYAAEWTFESLSQSRRSAIRKLPRWVRARVLIRLARQVSRETFHGCRCVASVRQGEGRIDLDASVFCSVREPVGKPLCGFYAAAFTKLAALLDLGGAARVVACRGTGERSCVFLLPLSATVAEGAGGPKAA